MFRVQGWVCYLGVGKVWFRSRLGPVEANLNCRVNRHICVMTALSIGPQFDD